jgi:hypothetical protein
MSLTAQKMKTRPDALTAAKKECGSAKYVNGTRRPRYRPNDFGSAKHENGTQCTRYRERNTLKRDTTLPVSHKMSQGAQNIKMRPDALGTGENEFGSATHDNGTRRPRYHQK